MNARRHVRVLTAAGLLGLVAAGWLAWQWLGHRALPPWQAAQWLPKEAEVVVWTAPLGEVADGLGGIASKVQGLGGAVEALRLATGVDLGDPDSTERAGLRRDAGLAVSLWQGTVWLALPVADRTGVDHVLEQLRRRGYGVQQVGQEGDRPHWTISGRDESPAALLQAWDTGEALLLAGAVEPDAATPTMAAFAGAAKLTPDQLGGGAGTVHGQWRLDASRPSTQRLRASLHQLAGLSDFLVGGAVDQIERLDLDISAEAKGIHATLSAASALDKLKDFADYYANFVPAGSELDVGDLLPDETPLLVRARLNPALWSVLPEALQALILPQWALQLIHPSLSGLDARLLVGDVDGQIALGVLAVADTLPLDPRMWTAQSWRTALRPFICLSMRSDVQARTWLDRVRTAVETGADRTTPAATGTWSGFSVPGPGAPWWLLQRGRALVFLSGQGTADDLRRMDEQRIGRLGGAVAAGREQQLVAGTQRGDGVLLTTPRIVRSLRRRGVPDYATGMIGAIDAIALTLELQPSGVVLDLVLRPDQAEGEASQAVSGAGGPR